MNDQTMEREKKKIIVMSHSTTITGCSKLTIYGQVIQKAAPTG